MSEDRGLWSDKPLYDSLHDNDSYYYYHNEYSYKLGSDRVLYDYDMKQIILSAKRIDGVFVRKSTLIRCFYTYKYENKLRVKIETFLRKLRYYASCSKYITYTSKRGIYKVLI